AAGFPPAPGRVVGARTRLEQRQRVRQRLYQRGQPVPQLRNPAGATEPRLWAQRRGRAGALSESGPQLLSQPSSIRGMTGFSICGVEEPPYGQPNRLSVGWLLHTTKPAAASF